MYKDPVKGLHENIVSFDFRSLYPSIILSKNISPDSLMEDCDEENCYISPEAGHKFRKEPIGFVPSVIGKVIRDCELSPLWNSPRIPENNKF